MASIFQFSIRGLLVAIAVVALGTVALLNANPWWETFAWGAGLVLLACSILLVVYRREEQRAYWLGFSIFGGLYLALLMFISAIEWRTSIYGGGAEPFTTLGTTRVSQLVYETVLPISRRAEFVPMQYSEGTQDPVAVYGYAIAPASSATMAPSTSPQRGSQPPGNVNSPLAVSLPPPTAVGTIMTSPPQIPNADYIPIGTFVSIGHSLWLLFIAAAGGKVCQIIYRTRPASQE